MQVHRQETCQAACDTTGGDEIPNVYLKATSLERDRELKAEDCKSFQTDTRARRHEHMSS